MSSTLAMELSLFDTGQQYRRTLLAYRNGWIGNPGVSQTDTSLPVYVGTPNLVNFNCNNFICLAVDNQVTVTLVMNSVSSIFTISDIFILSFSGGFTVSVSNTSVTNTVNLTASFV